MVVLIILSVSLGNTESRRHEDNYISYRNADDMYMDDKLEDALSVYTGLAAEYPRSYVLEYKAAMCEYYLDNYESAIAHAMKTLELYPRLLEETEFLDFLEDCLKLSGDTASAEIVSARLQTIGR